MLVERQLEEERKRVSALQQQLVDVKTETRAMDTQVLEKEIVAMSALLLY